MVKIAPQGAGDKPLIILPLFSLGNDPVLALLQAKAMNILNLLPEESLWIDLLQQRSIADREDKSLV